MKLAWTGFGRAEGAVNVPLDQLTDAVNSGRLPDKDAPIAIICQSGRRSAQAAVKLARVHGFTNVVNVKGGEGAWRCRWVASRPRPLPVRV